MPSKKGQCETDGCVKAIQIRNMCKACYEKFRRSHKGHLSSEHGSIREISNIDAAYMAGMIDADGMITVSSPSKSIAPMSYTPRERPLVVVTNSDMELINWLKDTIGAGTAYETKSQPNRPDQDENNWNKVHRFQMSGWKAIRLLEEISPYLKIKKKQAELVMRMPVRGRDFNTKATDLQVELVKELAGKIRLLNRRGFKKHCLFAPLLL